MWDVVAALGQQRAVETYGCLSVCLGWKLLYLGLWLRELPCKTMCTLDCGKHLMLQGSLFLSFRLSQMLHCEDIFPILYTKDFLTQTGLKLGVCVCGSSIFSLQLIFSILKRASHVCGHVKRMDYICFLWLVLHVSSSRMLTVKCFLLQKSSRTKNADAFCILMQLFYLNFE